MPIAIGEDHDALRAAVTRWVDSHAVTAEARGRLEDAPPGRPAFWPDLVAQGWPGLHVPEPFGGQGFGILEVSVVLEALGEAVAPGPLLPTTVAAAVLVRALAAVDLAAAAMSTGGTSAGGSSAGGSSAGGTSAGGTSAGSSSAGGSSAGSTSADRTSAGGALASLLRGLATGERTAAVVLPGAGRLAGGSEVRGEGGCGTAVAGTLGPVLDGAEADVLLAPLAAPVGGAGWVAVPMGQSTVTVEPLPSLDPTRPVANVTAAGADALLLPAVDDATVTTVARALVAAECAGGCRWCTDTAAEHARTRRQFGRPIGQFQAVKHKVADMLVTTEAVAASAWDAARAADAAATGGAEAGAAHLSAAAAAALALDGYARCAKDAIQVLGGTGFTWEHDAHLHLRRAVSLAGLLDPTASRLAVADLAIGGVGRHPDAELPTETEAVRARIGALVDEVAAAPPEERRRRLVDAGLVAPHWPPPYGRGAGPVEQIVIDQELARVRIRRPSLAVGAWALPTLIAHGTATQQERWIRPTLLGELTWCQLFSEPEAGSDLASLRTRATRVEGGWVLDGQKVWTSLAGQADLGICLVRTDPAAPRHEGITYVVVDMRADGVDVRPLRELTGDALFNEVFLDQVFVPDDHVVGQVGGGWELARTTLANERVQMSSGATFGAGVAAVLDLWRRTAEKATAEKATADGHRTGATADGHRTGAMADRVGALVAEAAAVAALGDRSTRRALSGVEPGPEASVRKLLGAEHEQRVQELGLALLGPAGAVADGDGARWGHGFLVTRCLTIAGGTSEVQRNVIAERLLGLPRDPEPPEPR